ncbi:MAG: SsrA-binding protein [Flavobacteriaceae bacterium]|nr:SsrA-binding protein [Flavobacteriaceae bacterium]|tara:strand:- start:297 stop:446 length:150 start_codon:yes stop_codon:yes gene_type:complete
MKSVFKILAKLNKIILPSLTKKKIDLTKVNKFHIAILGWKAFVTLRSLD